MQFMGEIYTPYIGISLVQSSGCICKGNHFYDFFFSGGSAVLSEVNSGGGGGGSEISGVPPPRYI